MLIGPITVNGRGYTKLYALMPIRSTMGQWIWFKHYYIRPDQYFEGRLLTEQEFQQETRS
jgi:hypothetical protein